ncbi:MAG: polyhydroxyalkanoate synthesis repressor PhaR [Rhodobacteraceae bacterium]|nr:polyhydroxyalkanoate synthesis repressor PhaR [Paracoccaceae bacterium]
MSDGQKPLLIKRYASRRLYNTETSEYTTLEEVSDIIKSGRDVKIIDKVSGEDLSREYMVRIIVENESRELPVLPLDTLQNMVRSYNEKTLALVPKFLEASYEMLNKSQNQIMENFQNVSDPLKNLKDFQESQKEILSAMFPFITSSQRKENSEAKVNNPELDELKKQMAEMQKKLDNMGL